MFQEGLLVVVSGPSGTGKGTVLKFLKQENANVRYSVSATTRKPREGEVEGVSYFFKTVEEFKTMINQDELVEWDEYCGNYYGTPKKYIEDSIKQGFDVILEITVEGAMHIQEKYPDSVSIFILPPSFQELQRRIIGRGTEKPAVIEKRMEKAKWEMRFVQSYDYIVINDEIDSAAEKINDIISAEKLRYKRNTGILKEIGIE
jgi:guanylate kinase